MSDTNTTPAEVRIGSVLDELDGIDGTKMTRDTARAALAELIAERDRLRNMYEAANANSAAMAKMVDRLQPEVKRLNDEVSRLHVARSDANADADRYQRERNEAHERIAKIRELVRQNARNSLALADIL